jgi:hypothetical protein
MNEALEASAKLIVDAWWTRGREHLDGAKTELGVCLELFEADLSKEPAWYQRWYERASPRRRFQIFLRAMKLPEFGTSSESVLIGLSLDELELVWVALHLDYMQCTADPNSADMVELACRGVSARNVQMILMHRLTRELCST